MVGWTAEDPTLLLTYKQGVPEKSFLKVWAYIGCFSCFYDHKSNHIICKSIYKEKIKKMSQNMLLTSYKSFKANKGWGVNVSNSIH